MFNGFGRIFQGAVAEISHYRLDWSAWVLDLLVQEHQFLSATHRSWIIFPIGILLASY
jgi:hypothetical protein